MLREVLGPVADLQLVAVHQGLHGAQVGERREHGHFDVLVVLVAQAERELLHQRDRLEVVAVHLPVAGDQRQLHRESHNARKAYASRAVRPGRVLPSRYSSDAPPPVEMCPKDDSSSPKDRPAPAESPPPTTVSPATLVSASATALVPAANAGNSNTPIGPFQNTVLASASLDANSSLEAGPMSRPMCPSGIASAATTAAGASAANRGATTMSVGRTSSTPRSAARVSISLHESMWSASSSEVPTSWPRAARNV